MTTTLIALISVAFGILGGILTGVFYKDKSFDFTGNTIAGAFGGVFFIKLFSRIGFDPVSIMTTGSPRIELLCINFIVSFLGGVIAVILLKRLERKMNRV